MVLLMGVSRILEKKTDDCRGTTSGGRRHISMIWMKTCMGKKIEVHFLDFMRPEMKFSGVDELKMQV